MTVQREVGAHHEIRIGLVPAFPLLLVTVHLGAGPREVHGGAEAELETVPQFGVLRRQSVVGVDQTGKFRVLFRSHLVGEFFDAPIELYRAVGHRAELLEPPDVALVEAGFGFCPADFGGDGRIVRRHAAVADAADVGIVAFEVDARELRIEVVQPVPHHLPLKRGRSETHADVFRGSAEGTAGAVGQQVEELRVGREVFPRPLFEAVRVMLFREVAVAAVAQQPTGLAFQVIGIHLPARPRLDMPHGTPEEEFELGPDDT